MARGTTLSTLVRMLKAEIGDELTAGVASSLDAQYKLLLSNKQAFLWGQYDWPQKSIKRDVSLSAGVRYYAMPTDLEIERGVVAQVRLDSIWSPLEYGIDWRHMNATNSDDNETSDPVCAWQLSESGNVAAAESVTELVGGEGGEAQAGEGGELMAGEGSTGESVLEFEVWPIPASAQTIRFTGQKTLAALASDSDKADLDDLLLVLLVAAEVLTRRKHADAQAKLALANAHLSRLRAMLPRSNTMFVMGGGDYLTSSRNGVVSIRQVVPGGAIAGEGGGYILSEGGS